MEIAMSTTRDYVRQRMTSLPPGEYELEQTPDGVDVVRLYFCGRTPEELAQVCPCPPGCDPKAWERIEILRIRFRLSPKEQHMTAL
jgi:hypothetical protein